MKRFKVKWKKNRKTLQTLQMWVCTFFFINDSIHTTSRVRNQLHTSHEIDISMLRLQKNNILYAEKCVNSIISSVQFFYKNRKFNNIWCKRVSNLNACEANLYVRWKESGAFYQHPFKRLVLWHIFIYFAFLCFESEL